MQENATEHKWYAIKVMNNKEKEVKKVIEREVEIHNFQKYFSEVMIATEREIKSVKGKKYTYEKVTYAGYVFIKCYLTPELEKQIKNIQAVLMFVGDSKRNAIPLRQIEVDAMIGRIEDKKTEGDPLKFHSGDWVKILDGAFATFVGEIVSTLETKATIEVKIFGRATTIDLEYTHFEKCDPPAAPVEREKRKRTEKPLNNSKATATKVDTTRFSEAERKSEN